MNHYDPNDPNQKPFSKYDVLRQPQVSDNNLSDNKSYAQVETCVAQSVRHMSCGLKSVHRKKGKSETLGIRFRAEELGIIRTKAMQAGCNTNTYIRASALGSDYKQPRDPELLNALNTAVRELTMQGINLNQIARRVNSENIPLGKAEGLLGMIACSIFKAHETVSAAIRQGRDWPEE